MAPITIGARTSDHDIDTRVSNLLNSSSSCSMAANALRFTVSVTIQWRSLFADQSQRKWEFVCIRIRCYCYSSMFSQRNGRLGLEVRFCFKTNVEEREMEHGVGSIQILMDPFRLHFGSSYALTWALILCATLHLNLPILFPNFFSPVEELRAHL